MVTRFLDRPKTSPDFFFPTGLIFPEDYTYLNDLAQLQQNPVVILDDPEEPVVILDDPEEPVVILNDPEEDFAGPSTAQKNPLLLKCLTATEG